MAGTQISDVNVFPKFDNWTSGADDFPVDMSTVVVTDNGYSVQYQVTQEEAYLQYEIKTGIAGKKFVFGYDDFSSSDGRAWIHVRLYDTSGGYDVLVDTEKASGPAQHEFDIPTDAAKLRIRFRHMYGDNINATLTVRNAYLKEIVPVESKFTLNFHKVQQEKLPASVEPGTEHVYYTTDGTRVRMYISNKAGDLIEVTGLNRAAAGESESVYHNVYTDNHIAERKQDIVDLTKDGHCLVFAVATDIHVRIEDGDAGRYNQVRDFIPLTEQLPIDYVICEGDIMSYCQEWDGVFEPRTDAVRKIFDKMRAPWYVTRGNHDYNDDDFGHQNNENIKEYTKDNCDDYFITDRDWTRTIASKMPNVIQHEVHFSDANPENGYFYVDDKIHKHRIIVCNSEETMETDDGHAYVNSDGLVDAYISGVESKQQIDWLIDYAMNFSDKGEDAQNWVVSFHSHTVPYTDHWIGYTGEDGELGGYKVYDADKRESADVSEFHGYGWDNPEVRKLIRAFQDGTAIDFKKSVVNVDDVNDGRTNHVWIDYQRRVDFTEQGSMKVLGWFGGHCHDDCYKKVNNLNIMISTCTCAERRRDWGHDPTPSKMAPDRNSTDLAMSVNVFVVNLDKRCIDVVKVGSKRDNADKTSSDIHMTY